MNDRHPSAGYEKMHAAIQKAETVEDIHRLDDWTDKLADEALRRSRALLGETTKALPGSPEDDD